MRKNKKENTNNLFNTVQHKIGFSQLLSKIKSHFFPPEPIVPELDPEIKLKAKKIDGDASKILNHLIYVKNQLESELDVETYGYLVRILNPLADDVKKMNGLLKTANQNEELSLVMERYQQWMTKAKSWIRLGSESNHSEHIVQEIVEHLLGELHATIDRDIHSITNYRQQVLDALSAEAPEEPIENQLIASTTPHICALQALKERKIHPELEKFTEWKRWVNSRRAVLFENALLVLDEFRK